MNLRHLLPALLCFSLLSCSKLNPDWYKNEQEKEQKEDPSEFTEVGSIDIGDAGAAEISAYDSKTRKLFVVNNSNTNKIDVIPLANLSSLSVEGSIDVLPYGGFVNSVAVSDGLLAAAIESTNKQQPGKVVVFKTSDYTVVKVIPVGSLPDMIAFSPDGKFILTANEGEPATDYSVDPVGTVSVISVKDNYAVVNIDFSSFAAQQSQLKSKGLRVFGLSADFSKDMEPEYLVVSEDSKTAWVTLQENNAIAKIDLGTKRVTDIFPLGFKDYSLAQNSIDPGDRDSRIAFAGWPVKGMYQPDAIDLYIHKGVPHLFTANEGDVREYNALNEAKRITTITLDPGKFPNAASLLLPEQLGRLNITTTLGDTDGDKDFDELYSFGARSFSVWNGQTGTLVFDSKNELDRKANESGIYDDARSDDKGTEPEGLTIGSISNKPFAFVGLERADAVAIYDISNPSSPKFSQMIKTGDAPEGLLFIEAKNSPTGRSLLVVSSEGDGTVKFYSPRKL